VTVNDGENIFSAEWPEFEADGSLGKSGQIWAKSNLSNYGTCQMKGPMAR
jgi:hypothetical protein